MELADLLTQLAQTQMQGGGSVVTPPRGGLIPGMAPNASPPDLAAMIAMQQKRAAMDPQVMALIQALIDAEGGMPNQGPQLDARGQDPSLYGQI